MNGPIDITDESGEPRRLGLLPQARTAMRRSWRVLGIDPETANVIPKDQWVPTNLKAWCPPPEDQNGIGMCASSGTETAYTVSRKIAGYNDPRLSAGDLYRRVCGGTDQGSMTEDNLIELIDSGVATVGTVPYLNWKSTNAAANAERPLYKGLEAILCPTAEHVASAIIAGFPVLIGYKHYSKDPVSADGWMDRPSGSWGGHAVCVVGLVKKNSAWGFEFENSWTASFGIDGFAILPESRVENGCDVFQAWALRCVRAESGTVPAPVN